MSINWIHIENRFFGTIFGLCRAFKFNIRRGFMKSAILTLTLFAVMVIGTSCQTGKSNRKKEDKAQSIRPLMAHLAKTNPEAIKELKEFRKKQQLAYQQKFDSLKAKYKNSVKSVKDDKGRLTCGCKDCTKPPEPKKKTKKQKQKKGKIETIK